MQVGFGLLLAQVTPSEGLSTGGVAALVAMLVLVGLVAWRVLRAQRGQQQQRMADLDGPTRRDALLEQATQVAANKGRSTEQEYLRAGLKKTRLEGFVARLTKLFGEHQLDEALVEQIEEVLFRADLGVKTTQSLIAELKAEAAKKELSDPAAVWQRLRQKSEDLLVSVGARPLVTAATDGPAVWLVVGVNGSGKTTTIGKLAKTHRDAGLAVTLAAGDTFRAAAVEQLKVWGERTGCPVIARDTGADAAGLAYDALAEARKGDCDLLFIDTAGRLQNKADLMAELAKIVRSIQKVDDTAPHDVLLVLDATTGQNAHSQVEIFKGMVNVTGLVLTKLDGTARGGVLVALAEKFGLPVHAIGVGEKAEDLRPFEAAAFARSLVGLDS